jgi:1-acyl-sn-glycerol-3-phosphate acyltransferase
MTDSPAKPFLYALSQHVLVVMFKLFHRLEVHGAEHVPSTGGCLLASNHVSFLDPPAIGSAVANRVVRFMARDTLFKKGFGNWFMKGVAAIPISRDRGDIGALKRCIHCLRHGDCIGIFPEGTRSRDGKIAKVKAGIGFIIMSAGVPVVPVFIDGTYAALPRGGLWPRPKKVRVFIGPPISTDELLKYGKGRESYEPVSQLIMERIQALQPVA